MTTTNPEQAPPTTGEPTMKHVMLDLETMSTQTTAAIVAIGAVEFDPISGNLGREFYTAVDLVSCERAGLTIDAPTVCWWMQQSAEACAALENGVTIQNALIAFSRWISPTSPAIWGNGVDFDNAILINAYKTLIYQTPWSHRQNRCYRTLNRELRDQIPFERVGTHHHALDDAKSQALHCIKLLRKLHGTQS